jgi:hypothetical protein
MPACAGIIALPDHGREQDQDEEDQDYEEEDEQESDSDSDWSRGFCTSVLAAFKRRIAIGYTTAPIANGKIGAGLRHFGPHSLKPRCKPQPVPRLSESSQPALQTRLTAAKPRQRPSSTATRKMAENGAFFEGQSAKSSSAYVT